MNTKIEIGNSYLIEIRLVDPFTNEQYTRKCLAEVVDWFANGPHFYFDDGYGLERLVKVNSQSVVVFKCKQAEFTGSAFKADKGLKDIINY